MSRVDAWYTATIGPPPGWRTASSSTPATRWTCSSRSSTSTTRPRPRCVGRADHPDRRRARPTFFRTYGHGQRLRCPASTLSGRYLEQRHRWRASPSSAPRPSTRRSISARVIARRFLRPYRPDWQQRRLHHQPRHRRSQLRSLSLRPSGRPAKRHRFPTSTSRSTGRRHSSSGRRQRPERHRGPRQSQRAARQHQRRRVRQRRLQPRPAGANAARQDLTSFARELNSQTVTTHQRRQETALDPVSDATIADTTQYDLSPTGKFVSFIRQVEGIKVRWGDGRRRRSTSARCCRSSRRQDPDLRRP